MKIREYFSEDIHESELTNQSLAWYWFPTRVKANNSILLQSEEPAVR